MQSTLQFSTRVDFTCSVHDDTTRLPNTLIHRPTPHKVQQSQYPLDFISTDYNISLQLRVIFVGPSGRAV